MQAIYKNKIEELERLADDIQSFGEKYDLDVHTLYNLNLCIDEIFTNIIYHGFDDNIEHEIEVIVDCQDQEIVATVTDSGKAFNPLTEAATPDITTPLEERQEGGLGIYFLKQLMDKVSYERKENKNILTMRKVLKATA